MTSGDVADCRTPGAAVGLVAILTCPLDPMDAIFSFLGVAGNRSIVKLEVFPFRPQSSRLFAGVRGVCPHFVPMCRESWGFSGQFITSDQVLLWCADRDLNPEPVD